MSTSARWREWLENVGLIHVMPMSAGAAIVGHWQDLCMATELTVDAWRRVLDPNNDAVTDADDLVTQVLPHLVSAIAAGRTRRDGHATTAVDHFKSLVCIHYVNWWCHQRWWAANGGASGGPPRDVPATYGVLHVTALWARLQRPSSSSSPEPLEVDAYWTRLPHQVIWDHTPRSVPHAEVHTWTQALASALDQAGQTGGAPLHRWTGTLTVDDSLQADTHIHHVELGVATAADPLMHRAWNLVLLVQAVYQVMHNVSAWFDAARRADPTMARHWRPLQAFVDVLRKASVRQVLLPHPCDSLQRVHPDAPAASDAAPVPAPAPTDVDTTWFVILVHVASLCLSTHQGLLPGPGGTADAAPILQLGVPRPPGVSQEVQTDPPPLPELTGPPKSIEDCMKTMEECLDLSSGGCGWRLEISKVENAILSAILSAVEAGSFSVDSLGALIDETLAKAKWLAASARDVGVVVYDRVTRQYERDLRKKMRNLGAQVKLLQTENLGAQFAEQINQRALELRRLENALSLNMADVEDVHKILHPQVVRIVQQAQDIFDNSENLLKDAAATATAAPPPAAPAQAVHKVPASWMNAILVPRRRGPRL